MLVLVIALALMLVVGVAVAAVLLLRLRRQVESLGRERQQSEAYALRLERDVLQLLRDSPLDSLTGLANAQRTDEDWRRLVARAQRRQEPFCFVTIVAERPGGGVHAARDRDELATVAKALLSVVRAEDHVYRLGGQTFGVFLSGSDRTGAEMFLGRVMRVLADVEPAEKGGLRSVSGGVAQWREEMASFDVIQTEAESDRRVRLERVGPRPSAGQLARMSGPRRRTA